jgi:hypothetical protein
MQPLRQLRPFRGGQGDLTVTSSSWARQSIASQSVATSSGPFTSRAAIANANACAVICVQLVLRFQRPSIEASKAHPVHVSSLSGQATACIRPVIQDDCEGCSLGVPVSRRLSTYRHWLLGPSCARCGVGPPSRSAYREHLPDRDGVVTFHMVEIRPGWALPAPRGGGVLRGWLLVTSRRLPSRNGPALPPAVHPISGGIDIEASSRVRECSPVRPSPCLWPPDGAGALGRLP